MTGGRGARTSHFERPQLPPPLPELPAGSSSFPLAVPSTSTSCSYGPAPTAGVGLLRLREGCTQALRRPLPVRREGRRDGSPRRSEVTVAATAAAAPATAAAAPSAEPVPRRRPRFCRLPRALCRRRGRPCGVTCAPTPALQDHLPRPRGGGGGAARGAVATPLRVSPGGAAGPGLLQPPGCAHEPSPPLPCCHCHDWSRLSPAAGSARARASPLVEPPGRAPPGM